jgi:very-short-patch-repair endonuclease
MRSYYPSRATSSLSLKGRGTGAKRQGEGAVVRGKTPDELLERARSARKDPTEAEDKLWSRLRDRRLQGWKFRRQEPIGPYRPDFVCAKAKLIVELDGSQHVDAVNYDESRTKFLTGQGYRVIRFWNNEVFTDMDSVLEKILSELEQQRPHPARFASCPSPLQGEGI